MAAGHVVSIFADEYRIVLDGGAKVTYQDAYNVMTEALKGL